MNAETYRRDPAIAQVDAEVKKNQKPCLRILDGHPGLLPFEGSGVQHAGLIPDGSLYRNGPLPFVEEYCFRG
jgi:hypothetical protein